jgi:branched-chain amino acid transport system ATP-binding protein
VTALLELEGVTRDYGGLRAVDGVDLVLHAGARHGLIGPNGAGKSTLFKLIRGGEAPTAGHVRFDGRDVTHVREHRRARMGIAQTFQASSLFLSLTCRENVLLALQRASGEARRFARSRSPGVDADADRMLGRVGLREKSGHGAATLSHGERRQLEVAIALASSPRLLLLDEPAAGMSPAEIERLAAVLEGLDDELAVLIVEHDLDFVFRVARDVSVLHLGVMLLTAPAAEVRTSDDVARVYMGGASIDDIFIDPEEAEAAR